MYNINNTTTRKNCFSWSQVRIVYVAHFTQKAQTWSTLKSYVSEFLMMHTDNRIFRPGLAYFTNHHHHQPSSANINIQLVTQNCGQWEQNMYTSNLTPLVKAPLVVNTNLKHNQHITVNLMQSSSTSGADGCADLKPNGSDAPLNKWITINGQALIPSKLLFSKKACRNYLKFQKRAMCAANDLHRQKKSQTVHTDTTNTCVGVSVWPQLHCDCTIHCSISPHLLSDCSSNCVSKP